MAVLWKSEIKMSAHEWTASSEAPIAYTARIKAIANQLLWICKCGYLIC